VSIFKAGLLPTLLIEIVIFILHSPLLSDFSYSMKNRIQSNMDQLSSVFTFDQTLTFLNVLKFYFILKLLPLITSVTADHSRKISEIKGMQLYFKFYVNVSFIERPFLVLITIALFIIVLFGLSIHLYENGQFL